MNSLTRIMSYDKTKIKNQEKCSCKECISEIENTSIKIKNIKNTDDFLIKVKNYRMMCK